VPGDHIVVKTIDGDQVQVVTCDPGVNQQQGLEAPYGPVVQMASVRSSLAAHYYTTGTKIPNGPNGPVFTTDESWCMADAVVKQAKADRLDQVEGATGDLFEQLTLSAGPGCGTTMAPQLFNGS
jgi:hypothetical protein